jgi:hypothetical protein
MGRSARDMRSEREESTEVLREKAGTKKNENDFLPSICSKLPHDLPKKPPRSTNTDT